MLGPLMSCSWVAVKEFKLSYHNPEITLCTTYPYDGNLKKFLNSYAVDVLPRMIHSPRIHI